ncbi:hypothetical protein BH20ACT9_BH20ACT9_01970 [soil metagenome]
MVTTGGAGSGGLRVVRNPPLDDALVDRLVRMWADVTNAGGAVGFVAPVTPAEVLPTARLAFDRVRDGRDDLTVAVDDGDPVGLGFLHTNDWPLHAHWATVQRLQRHPAYRGRSVGGALLTELERAAAERGLEGLVLTVRGGTGTEHFYAHRGFRIDARLPGRVKVGQGDVREEVVMSKPLGEPVAAGGPELLVRRLDPGLPVPAYAHPDDAGLDLRARVDVALAPGARAVVPTGVAIAVPDGHVGLVHPRSGLAARHGVGLVNAPGTVDAGYRGEVKVVLVNLDPHEPVELRRGDRIAQLVVQRVETVRVVEVDRLPATPRGEGGFGSSGR